MSLTNKNKILIGAILLSTLTGYFAFTARAPDSLIKGGDLPYDQTQQKKQRPTAGSVSKPAAVAVTPPSVPSPGRTPRTEAVESALKSLDDLSKQYSGNELAGQQLRYIKDLLDNNKLDASELIQFSGQLHYYMPDSQMIASWSLLLSGAVCSPGFSLDASVKDLPEGKLGTDLAGQLGGAYAEMGQPLSPEQIASLKSSLGKDGLGTFIEKYCLYLCQYNPQQALQIASDNRAEIGDTAYNNAINHLTSNEDFKNLKSSIPTEGTLSPRDTEVLSNFSSGWAKAAPQDAANWVSNIADPAIRSSASEALINQWSITDLKGASEWLASTSLQGYDPAIAIIARRLARYSPQEASTWASNIQDPNLQKQVMNEIKK